MKILRKTKENEGGEDRNVSRDIHFHILHRAHTLSFFIC